MLAARHAPYWIGTLTAGSIVADPTNAVGPYDESRAFTVSIPGIPDMDCELARKEPDSTERGTLIFATGADGSSFAGGSLTIETWIESLVDAGWRIIQLRWPTGWNNSSSTGNHGPARLAGRGASVVRYVHETYCGTVDNLWLNGGSGGGSLFAYCLSHYGLGNLVSGFVPAGGPPHASLYDLCVGSVGLVGDINNRKQIDDSYEQTVVAGACELQDASSKGSAWAYDSIIAGNLAWPRTTYCWGEDDDTPGPAHGALIADRQLSSLVRRAFLHGTPHNVLSSENGRAGVADAISERPFIRQSNPVVSGTATSLSLTLAQPVVVGNLLVVVHRAAGTALADMSAPTGFTLADDGIDNAQATAGTAGVKVYWKIATGGEESSLSGADGVETTTSVAQAADFFEVDSYDVGSWSVEFVDIEADSGASVTTLTTAIGPTGTPTAKSFCIAAIGTFGGFGGAVPAWTNGFAGQVADAGRRLMTASRSIDVLSPVDTNVTWGSATRAAGILVTFRQT